VTSLSITSSTTFVLSAYLCFIARKLCNWCASLMKSSGNDGVVIWCGYGRLVQTVVDDDSINGFGWFLMVLDSGKRARVCRGSLVELSNG
jgi:hypothetical protein